MLSPEAFYDIYHLIVTLLVYIVILINLVLLKGTERIVIAIAVVIYFILIYAIPDFLLTANLVTLLFVIAGVNFIAHKEILIVMGLIVILLPRDSPVYILFSVAFYVITLSTFIFNTIKLVKESK